MFTAKGSKVCSRKLGLRFTSEDALGRSTVPAGGGGTSRLAA